MLDGGTLHPVAGEAVGELDVLGDVFVGELPHDAGVGLQDESARMGRSNSPPGAVVHVDSQVVVAANDAVSRGNGQRPVFDIGPELAGLAPTGTRAVVQERRGSWRRAISTACLTPCSFTAALHSSSAASWASSPRCTVTRSWLLAQRT